MAPLSQMLPWITYSWVLVPRRPLIGYCRATHRRIAHLLTTSAHLPVWLLPRPRWRSIRALQWLARLLQKCSLLLTKALWPHSKSQWLTALLTCKLSLQRQTGWDPTQALSCTRIPRIALFSPTSTRVEDNSFSLPKLSSKDKMLLAAPLRTRWPSHSLAARKRRII